MSKIGSLQIGHSTIKENDFKIECGVANDRHVEVPFSHRHFFYAVYWIHGGNGTHVIDFEEYEIKPDRIFFIRPEQIHLHVLADALTSLGAIFGLIWHHDLEHHMDRYACGPYLFACHNPLGKEPAS